MIVYIKTRIFDVISKIVMYLVLFFTVVVSILPLIWVVLSSFKTNFDILANPLELPTAFNFDAYRTVWGLTDFPTLFINSFTIATSAVIVSLMIYSMAAYVIAKYDFRFKNVVYALFVLTLLVPTHARAAPVMMVTRELGLFDTRMALILLYISIGMAISLFVLRSTFMSIPKELSEAAWIDGAGFIKTFFLINLPLAKTGFATAGTLMFIHNWNEYFFAALLTGRPENRTIPYAIRFFQGMFNQDFTAMFAALTLVILPGVAVYAVFQEQVARSLVSSGIKG